MIWKIFTALTLLVVSFYASAQTPEVWTVSTPETHTSLSTSGRLTLTGLKTGKTFSTELNPSQVTMQTGSDSLGSFSEVRFLNSTSLAQKVNVKVYLEKPVIILSGTSLTGSANNGAFFSFDVWPQKDNKFGLTFWDYNFTCSDSESPCLFFDDQQNSSIISPADHFVIAQTNFSPSNSLEARVDPAFAKISPGYTHKVMITFGSGINSTFDVWGKSLSQLLGVARPANTQDVTLSHLSYWTDARSSYYYTPILSHVSADDPTGFQGTLLSIRSYFRDVVGIPLGSMQLDSWWYPKGPAPGLWSLVGSGIYRYQHDIQIFPDLTRFSNDENPGDGLQRFARLLGLPLVVHSRWIDKDSPYRQVPGLISGNVPIEKSWWQKIAAYLRSAGVATFEQDWLVDHAFADPDDRESYFDLMAEAMAGTSKPYLPQIQEAQTFKPAPKQAPITIQYCMPTPSHLMQSAKYWNVTTARISQDGFGEKTQFLFNSRLATAMGKWPFTDHVFSSNVRNLLLATLSAGPVGLGDAIGTVNSGNLSKAVRKDGAIVKPDTSLLPVGSVYVKMAHKGHTPMIAVAHTDYGILKVAYIYVYQQEVGTLRDETIDLSETGLSGSVYVYDYLNANPTGVLTDTHTPYVIHNQGTDGSYLVVVPAVSIGSSQLALLGDLGKFVSLGKQRVSTLSFDGSSIKAGVLFAINEEPVTLTGFATTKPHARVNEQAVLVGYDPSSQLFSVSVSPARQGPAKIEIFP